MTFPTKVGVELPTRLASFTSRLKNRVAADVELRGWLVHAASTRPLGTGLPGMYHVRWSVKVVKPKQGEPQGWYEDFVTRWQDYLVALVAGQTSRHATSAAVSGMRRARQQDVDGPMPKRRKKMAAEHPRCPDTMRSEDDTETVVATPTPRGTKRPRGPAAKREVKTVAKKAKTVTKSRSGASEQAVASSVEHVMETGERGVRSLAPSRPSRATRKRGKVGTGRATEGPGT